jgi:hypothetical protein
MDQLASKFGITTLDQWYSKTADDIQNNGGAGLLKLYKDSLPKLLASVYPEYPCDIVFAC